MSTKDYYSLLEVSQTASAEEIKRSYRRLAKNYHPDSNQTDKDAESKFKNIAEAYDVLGDESKRSQYDASLKGSGFFSININHSPSKSYDLEVQTQIEFSDVIIGCTKKILVQKQQICTECAGRGAKTFNTCSGCQGSGKVRLPIPIRIDCPYCGGSGQVPSDSCSSCGGSGQKDKVTEEIVVNIPAGIESGTVIVSAGNGNPKPGGGFGNLKIGVLVNKHKYFKRNGMDVFYILPLTYTQLLIGGSLVVPKLDGTVSIEIPPSTNHGAKFRLWGLGLPDVYQQSHRGDLIVVVQLDIPKEIPDEYREVVLKLAEMEKRYPTQSMQSHVEAIKVPQSS